VLIILIVLGVLAAATMKFAKPALQTQTVPITFTILVEGVREVTVNGMEEGAAVFEGLSGQRIGKMTAIAPRQAVKEAVTSDGRYVMADLPNRFDVEVTIQTEGVFSERGILFVGNDWQIGRDILVRSNQISVRGVIIEFQKGWEP
jgi:hypothetical protein